MSKYGIRRKSMLVVGTGGLCRNSHGKKALEPGAYTLVSADLISSIIYCNFSKSGGEGLFLSFWIPANNMPE
jgi:hypothetical protein